MGACMTWNPSAANQGVVVVDANVAIALAAREVAKEAQARAALTYYSNSGYVLFAPGVIVSETLFVLCGKEQQRLLSPPEYAQAIVDFHAFMVGVLPPPNGEASLILRADQIRGSYGCGRSADAIYIALAEELSQTHTTRLLTFDQGLPNQAARNAPLVSVHLLT